MNFRAIVIEPSNAPRIVEISSSDQLRKIVGGNLEFIVFGEIAGCYLNEDGKALNLPVNSIATTLCNTIGHQLCPGDYISGTLIIFGVFDEEGNYDGDEHDIPVEIVKQINEKYGINLS